MTKVKIIYDKDACIGAAACEAVDSENWVIGDDGRANLNDSTEIKEGLFEREAELSLELEDAVKSCPVNAIKIEKLE